MDCTYSTVKNDLPVFHVIGHTGTGQSFTSCLVWIPSESTHFYTLALKGWLDIMGHDLKVQVVVTDRERSLQHALDDVLPDTARIFCYWHLEQNVLAHRPQGIGESDYQIFVDSWRDWIVRAPTIHALEEGWRQLEERFGHETYSTALSYLFTLKPIEERFVHCHIDQHRHFGIRTTGRVEGSHSSMKQWLNRLKGDFVYVIRRLQPWWKQRWLEILGTVGRERLWNAQHVPYVLSEVCCCDGQDSAYCLGDGKSLIDRLEPSG